MVKLRIRVSVASAVAVLLAFPAIASAYSTAQGFVANDYATGFPESAGSHWGPVGMAFDRSDNLYVADTADGNIYRFQPGGGAASSNTRLTSSPLPGRITGLAISESGEVYLARYDAGDVVQLDPGTGQIMRTIASIPCATGLAIDPISGDLFASENHCGSTIYRISGYQHGPGTVSSYTSAPNVDGLAFDKTGILYAESDQNVLEIDGTNSATPGASTDIAHVPYADGLAFGAHQTGQPPFLVVNRNDGVVTRINLRHGSASEQDIFTGGTRGDFATVDAAGCLFITQSSSIVRITGRNSRCAFEPTGGGGGGSPGAGLNVATLSGARTGRACVRRSPLIVRVWQRGRVRLKWVIVYLNGRRIERLKGAAVTGRIVIKHPPTSAFRLKIVGITVRGARLVTRRFYRSCPRPRCVRTDRLSVPLPRGDRRIVEVAAYIRGRLVKELRGRNLKHIVLHNVPHRRFTVKLVMLAATGEQVTGYRTFVGCPARHKH